MSEDVLLPFGFPAIQRRKVTGAFDGGRLTSDGGVMLLAAAERRLGIADPRDPNLVSHSVADVLRARILAIACGYEDANDLDHLRADPAFRLARGRSMSTTPPRAPGRGFAALRQAAVGPRGARSHPATMCGDAPTRTGTNSPAAVASRRDVGRSQRVR